jgi:hypothetical protein
MPFLVLWAPNLAAAESAESLACMLTMLAVSFQRKAIIESVEAAKSWTMLSLRGSMFFISHCSQLYSTYGREEGGRERGERRVNKRDGGLKGTIYF